MRNPLRERLEADIEQLSVSDQLWLMERLAQSIRQRAKPALKIDKQDLIDMANDPDIQRELRQIEQELLVFS